MEIGITHLHNDQEKPEYLEDYNEEDNEEALSLRDLPLTTTTFINTTNHHDPATELFEFLSTSSDDMSPAEDIIVRGRLIPLNDQNARRIPSLPPKNSIAKKEEDKNNNDRNINPRIRIRSESLSAIQGNSFCCSSNVAGEEDIKLMRNSRSLDYRKLTRVSSIMGSPPESDRKSMERNSSVKSAMKSDAASCTGKRVRPRWYVIMFGMVRVPPEIELKDIKSRQVRLNVPSVLIPSPRDRSSGKGSPSSSWRFLKALSCREPASVAVTAPLDAYVAK